jgi:hypothetical protein
MLDESALEMLEDLVLDEEIEEEIKKDDVGRGVASDRDQ